MAALIDSLLLDVRYALRVLGHSPAFTLTALVTLALSIGANITVFGVLNSVVLQPLDVREPQNLYQIRHKPWMTGRLLTTSFPAFEDYERRNVTFSGMAAIYGYSGGTLRRGNAETSVHGDAVTGNYFDLLGVRPELGRFFHASDEHGPSSAPYLVLSDALWRSAFGADRSIIGASVQLAKQPFTVIGIARPEFHGAERFVWPDYWMPITNEDPDFLSSRTTVAVTVIGRLKPDVTPIEATENLNAIAAGLAREYPETDEGSALRLIHPGLFGDEGDVIRGFLVSVGVLGLLALAAACANLANLFAARAADRGRELATRVALGSSRRRLVGQLLTEAVIVSLAGGAIGMLMADLLLGALNRWRFDGHLVVGLDGRVFLAGLAVTLASALLFGMVPARRAWRSSPLQTMKGAMESAHTGRLAVRDLLLGVQIAICTLLVTASLVAVRGMQRALDAPLGIQPQGAMLAEVDLSEAGDEALQKEKAMIDATRRIPSVTAVGTVDRTPITGGLHGIPVYPPGTTEFRMNNYIVAPYVFSMSPGYLEAAGTRLLTGRDFSWRDTAKMPLVAIVNQTFARRMWGETSGVGQRFVLWRELREVVGVVEDGKYHDMAESPHPVVFLPFPQQSEQSATIFVVRSRMAPHEMAPALERALSDIEPNVPVSVESWSDQLSDALFPARAATWSLGVMGTLAAMLAVTGIFGMAAYGVSRRMKELGIRVALGARTTHIMTTAIGRPLVLLAVGSVVGLLSGVVASSLLGQIVYQANPRDPVVIGGAVVIMTLLGVVASAIPARRALAVDPVRVIREE